MLDSRQEEEDVPTELAPYAYMTTYDALLCRDCAETHPEMRDRHHGGLLGLVRADLADVYGYDSVRCEECKTVVYDGLAGGIR